MAMTADQKKRLDRYLVGLMITAGIVVSRFFGGDKNKEVEVVMKEAVKTELFTTNPIQTQTQVSGTVTTLTEITGVPDCLCEKEQESQDSGGGKKGDGRGRSGNSNVNININDNNGEGTQSVCSEKPSGAGCTDGSGINININNNNGGKQCIGGGCKEPPEPKLPARNYTAVYMRPCH